MESESSEAPKDPQPNTAWSDPEVVKKIIEISPPLIKQALEAMERSNGTGIEAAKVIHGRMFWLAMTVILTGSAVSIIALLQGNDTTPEKIIIPLLSFVGGLGLGNKLK